MSIEVNLQKVKSIIPAHVKLIAVSKTHPVDLITEAYRLGQRAFGENRPQEMMQKAKELPADIEWHFIGNLQTNKVKYIAPFVHIIHSVDSLKLLVEIDKEARKNNRTISCLLEFHIAAEDSKSGLDLEGAINLLNHPNFKQLNNIKIIGVMGMATFTDNLKQIHSEFCLLNDIFVHLNKKFFAGNPDFREISMGMSGDFEIAIECGSTMVRIGTAIFGSRY